TNPISQQDRIQSQNRQNGLRQRRFSGSKNPRNKWDFKKLNRCLLLRDVTSTLPPTACFRHLGRSDYVRSSPGFVNITNARVGEHATSVTAVLIGPDAASGEMGRGAAPGTPDGLFFWVAAG